MLLTAIFRLSYFCPWTLAQPRSGLKKLKLLISILPHVSADDPPIVRGFTHSATPTEGVGPWHAVLVISLFQRPSSSSALSRWLPALSPPASCALWHPCEVWWLVAPVTGVLSLSTAVLSPPCSSSVKFKAWILNLGRVMVVNTFHHSQDLVFLFGLFPALRCRESSLLWRLIVKERNLIRKAAVVVVFPPLAQTWNRRFAAPPVGLSDKKDAGLPRAPGATPIHSFPAPWERRRVSVSWPLSNCWVSSGVSYGNGDTSESGPAGTWRESGGCWYLMKQKHCLNQEGKPVEGNLIFLNYCWSTWHMVIFFQAVQGKKPTSSKVEWHKKVRTSDTLLSTDQTPDSSL